VHLTLTPPDLNPPSRSIPLSAERQYYPGFFAALFLVLLRIAIGWHFLNEGREKIHSYSTGSKPFSAESYLRNATGPLAPYFHNLVPDVNGLAKLDPDRLKAGWSNEIAQVAAHYGFSADQQSKAREAEKKSEEFADRWFHDRENLEKRAKYYHELGAVQKVEQDLGAIAFERERAWAKRKELFNEQKELTKDLDAEAANLRELVAKVATPEQARSAGPYKPWTQLDTMNYVVTYCVLIIGLCLMVGLLTRLAALGGAVFLLQIYLCIPPWPGLPDSPRAEGHYVIVDKNLIEMLACMALAFLPTGHWIGFDAIFFRRSRRARAAAARAGAAGAT
jgi:uncharacterized membrane protein YphA (DoxX/SURF4 family)